MEYKMQHNTDFVGITIATVAWIFMKVFLLIGDLSLAEYSSLCVILGVVWTFIANADKAITNIKNFGNYIQKLKKK